MFGLDGMIRCIGYFVSWDNLVDWMIRPVGKLEVSGLRYRRAGVEHPAPAAAVCLFVATRANARHCHSDTDTHSHSDSDTHCPKATVTVLLGLGHSQSL